ncbi:MAG: hypothetical protein Fur0032_02670 [Terrimicrobiaceae bacterium]
MSNFILPDLQSALLCEDVRQEASGAHTLVGVVNALPAPVVPIGIFRLCLWTRWCSGSGEFLQDSFIIAPDDADTRIAHAQVRFRLPEMESHATNVHVFAGFQLPIHGIYHVEIHLDGQFRMRFPFPVVPVPGAQELS